MKKSLNVYRKTFSETLAFGQKHKEKSKTVMILAALQNRVHPEALEALRKTAGLTDARFAQLKRKAKI